jgi:hypothetical protein
VADEPCSRSDDSSVVTLRRLYHIGVGRTHARTRVLLLIHNRDIRVINEHTGERPRELTSTPPGTTSPSTDPNAKQANP